jgi:6-pyruvoyltetrahydropterin/6-carboxytetrahydropterin synthase
VTALGSGKAMKVGKTFTFDAAHRLQNHDGKCKNLHGHTYQVEAIVEAPGLTERGPQQGMVIDFGELSGWWKPLEAILDHTVLLEETDPLVEALVGLTRVTTFDWPPTAENLAIHIRRDLMAYLAIRSASYNNWYTTEVRVCETTKTWAASN